MDKQLRHKLALISTYFLAYIVLGMTTATLGPSLPYLAAKVSTSLRGISSLSCSFSLGVIWSAS